MRSPLKKWFHYLRNQAVVSYEKTILQFLPSSKEPLSLLDCGCNDGEWTLRLGERVGDATLHGIEIEAEAVASAREKGVDAIEGNLNETLPFEDGRFDIVHANQVIEHLADTDLFLREIHRVLKPGGIAIVCTENLAGWHNIAALFFGWQPFSLTNICEKRFQVGNPLSIHNEEPAVSPKSWLHVRVFAYRGLYDVLREHGFHVTAVRGSGYYPLPGFLGRLDPRHAAFLTFKVQKPERE
jgi:SAM-dependent methyltransferase